MATPRPPRPDLSGQRGRSFPGREGADRAGATDAAAQRAALDAALRERRVVTDDRTAPAVTAADLRAVLARKLDERIGATR